MIKDKIWDNNITWAQYYRKPLKKPFQVLRISNPANILFGLKLCNPLEQSSLYVKEDSNTFYIYEAWQHD